MPSYELTTVFLLLPGVALISFGFSRLTAIRKRGIGRRKKWLSGLALGLGVTIVVSLVFFYFNGLYRLGQFDSAIATVYELVAAEARFAKLHPERGYTCNLSELQLDGWAIEGRNILVKTGQRSGYSFEIRGCRKREPNSTYEIIARPLHRGEKLCADQSGIVHFYEARCDQE